MSASLSVIIGDSVPSVLKIKKGKETKLESRVVGTAVAYSETYQHQRDSHMDGGIR